LKTHVNGDDSHAAALNAIETAKKSVSSTWTRQDANNAIEGAGGR
jgi:hypothetical protein